MAHLAASDSIESKLESKELRIDIRGKGTCPIENMAHPTGGGTSVDSIENKHECKELLIHILGKGTCQIENMACLAASDSTENKLEHRELLIDISGKGTCPIKKRARSAATNKIEGILARNDQLPINIAPARWPESCIYKVPKKLRDVNRKAYTPKLISIGPLHHGQQELKDMEMQKLRYFNDFFNRNEKITPKDLASIIKENEVKIRHCYAVDTIQLNSNDFINMILLDAIFIIELFWKNAVWSKSNRQDLVPMEHLLMNIDATDYMFSEKWLSYNLKQDLLLLENQLPFFILQELWEKSYHHKEGENGQKVGTSSFLKLAFTYFYELHPEKEVKDVKRKHFSDFQNYIDQSGKKVKHFTDMIRFFFYSKPKDQSNRGSIKLRKVFCSEDKSEDGGSATQVDGEGENFGRDENKGSIKHLYSATQLDEAGVKFKGVEKKPLLEINFNKNMCLEYFPFLNCSWILSCLPCLTCLKTMQPSLEVPTFEVNDETECVFRNLMAFEQCHSSSDDSDHYICNYILLLDRFINSEKDVDLLVDGNVIVNFLGSNQRVTNLVNKLCLEIVEPDNSRYDGLSERLNKHYRSCWNKNMAKLSRQYFGDIWRGTTTIVGFIILVFTLWNFNRILFK